MAQVSVERKLVEKVVKVEEPVVTLTLSKSEAFVLVNILGKIGGAPEYTPRKYSDEIYRKLNSAGITYIEEFTRLTTNQNAIYFDHQTIGKFDELVSRRPL